ncbi:unnamed protein product [Meganyctiphanes norvegica]|uniref:G-protein coupled receptors family 1 profile domain-containing protein n=1 Tax=Meganyctiphanes norvegica TaxID=48144 RepID=A0AAV2QUC7_MEGNR
MEINTTTYSPEDNNSSCSSHNGTLGAWAGMQYPHATLGFCAAMAFLIAIVGACGNILTIVALPMCKKLRTGAAASATLYVINLAVAELMFCLFILPMTGAQYIYLLLYPGQTLLNENACVFFATVRYTITQAELQTILAIAVTRAIAVRNPELYLKINTGCFTNTYIVGIWIWSFAMRLPITTGIFGKFTFNQNTFECDIDVKSGGVRLIYILLEIIIPVPIIIFLYLMIFCTVWCSARRVMRASMKSKTADVPNSPTSPLHSERKGSMMPLNERKDSLMPLQRGRIESITPECRGNLDTLGRTRAGSQQVFKFNVKESRKSLSRRASFTKDNKRELRLARTIFVVFLVVVICSIPVGVEHALNRTCVKNLTKFLLVHVLYWSQYCINIFVYVLMNKQYRDAYVECIGKFIPRFKSHKKRRFMWEENSAGNASLCE